MANPSLSLNLNLAPSTQQQPRTPPMEYSKGSWTVNETLTLITARRLIYDEDQRSSSDRVGNSAEKRRKWIEKYCCAHKCFRSQVQCHNKWHSLLRNYRQVSSYESQNASTEPGNGANRKSYWDMSLHEKKERKLPTHNMDRKIYNALTGILNGLRVAVPLTPVMTVPPQTEDSAMANPSLSLNLNLAPLTQEQPTTPPMEYSKGSWTVNETLTLITARRLYDEEQRSAKALSSDRVGNLAEKCWKWIENYCCAHECFRSQDQCKNKWHSLLSNYRKVSNYESKNTSTEPDNVANRKSYWEMSFHEKKERNLPTRNMDRKIYNALTSILNRRQAAVPLTPVLTLPPQAEDSAETAEDSEEDEPEKKRRKVRDSGMGMARTVSMLSQTMMICEVKKEQRHRELLELEERKLKLEEERSEMNTQALSKLLTVVNGLMNAVGALVSKHGQPGSYATKNVFSC